MRKKRLSLVLAILFVSNCARIPNVPLCARISENEGFCAYTRSKKEYSVTGNDWDNLKKEAIYMPPSSWSAIKKNILKLCQYSSNCSIRKSDNFLNVGEWREGADRDLAIGVLSNEI